MTITATTLSHPTTLHQIAQAMRDTAVFKHSVAHVRNKRGDAFVACRYLPHHSTPGRAFWFLDRAGRDVTETVYSVLRGAA